MILVDVTCAACPTTMRLLVATQVTDAGEPTNKVSVDDMMSQLAERRWSLLGPVCKTCADRMRRVIN